MRRTKRTSMMLVILAALVPASAHAQERIRAAVADAEITPFCLKMRMVRHPAFPTMREKYRLQFEDVLVVMAQAPVTVANRDLDIAECTGISTIIGLIEGIIYLTKTDEDFIQTYQIEKKAWF